jgi:hypothetical protein
MHSPAGEEHDREEKNLLPDRDRVDVAKRDEEEIDGQPIDGCGVRSLRDAEVERRQVRVGDGVEVDCEYEARGEQRTGHRECDERVDDYRSGTDELRANLFRSSSTNSATAQTSNAITSRASASAPTGLTISTNGATAISSAADARHIQPRMRYTTRIKTPRPALTAIDLPAATAAVTARKTVQKDGDLRGTRENVQVLRRRGLWRRLLAERNIGGSAMASPMSAIALKPLTSTPADAVPEPLSETVPM